MSTLFCDFETRSVADIKKSGVHVYVEHPSTDILCMGWAIDDGPVSLWTCPTDFFPFTGNETVVAHNAAFELAVWNSVGVRKYGWPVLKPEQVVCTMARSYAMAFPGALADAAPAAGLSDQKDAAGHRVMLQVSQPRKVIEGFCPDCSFSGADSACGLCFGTGDSYEWYTRENSPEKFEQLYSYCKQDVEVERQLFKRLSPLSREERDVWLLDQRINNRGIQIDIQAVRVALSIASSEKTRLDAEMRDVTSGQVATCTATAQIVSYLASFGIETKSVDKAAVADLLEREDISIHVRRVLELRQEAAKSSTKKLDAMLLRASKDGRIRGIFQYHGATTGRWAGRGIQPHNFPRPKLSQDEIENVFEILGGIGA